MITPVICSCGWRGRRKHRECECYEHPFGDCTPYGRCPKCRRELESSANRKARLTKKVKEDRAQTRATTALLKQLDRASRWPNRIVMLVKKAGVTTVRRRTVGRRLIFSAPVSCMGDLARVRSFLYDDWLDVTIPKPIRNGRIAFYVTRNPPPEAELVGQLLSMGTVQHHQLCRMGSKDAVLIRRDDGQIMVSGEWPHYMAIAQSWKQQEFYGGIHEVTNAALKFLEDLA